MMTSYNVTLTRDGNYWLVHIDGVKGLTQARHYDEVATMAREYISLVDDVDYDTITIGSITVDGVTDKVAQAEVDREKAKELETAASTKVREAARTLRDDGVPLTEIGQILGVSHQRAHQLTTV